MGKWARRIAWLLVAVGYVVMAGGGIWYTNYVQQQSEKHWEQLQQQSDQRWCDLISGLDAQYQQHPPATDPGKTFAANIHILRLGLGCK